jgi:2-keto-4-pentenoate hydratase/2-oxohepta-3-ene-1,7-dioic acid hydratase in catechol pathway
MDGGYRLISYKRNGRAEAGILIDGLVYPPADLAEGLANPATVMGLLAEWDKAHAALQKVTPKAKSGVPLADVDLLAPILYPGSLFCAGANYWDHLAEMAEVAKRTTGNAPSMTKGAEPWFFMKTTAGSIIGHNTPVRLPKFSQQVDWEGEIGVVIGRRTRSIAEAEALDAVAGYVIVNDLSARDLMKREGTPFIFDWIGQKCFADAAPMGPWFTPAAYIKDPQNLAIKLWVNGVLKQNSNTSKMVHSIAEQVAYLSRHFTLQPGDVVATGSPAGVGLPRGDFLKIGDEIKIEIESCGTLVNRMVADDR